MSYHRGKVPECARAINEAQSFMWSQLQGRHRFFFLSHFARYTVTVVSQVVPECTFSGTPGISGQVRDSARTVRDLTGQD